MDPIVSLAELIELGPRALVIIDARRSREAFLASHPRGARFVDLDRELAGPVASAAEGGRHPLPSPEAFAQTLSRLGVTPERDVVVYDDQSGAISAARLWWMLRAYGHDRVRVLDGGWRAITDAASRGELALESGEAPDAQSQHPVRAWTGETVDRSAVDRARVDPSSLVIDVRAADRFRGENETMDPVAGHIPGAINAPYATTNLDDAGRFLDATSLRDRYVALLRGRPIDRTIVHCGSGVTACHTLLALDRAGLHGAKLYVGSWSEWCRRPELPRETRVD
jgi:thiosulfate/3-mercaptopyruvate sulfurtransferase